ncbi:MAG TPA: alpha/beta hydrolase [Microlunatus sp.]
MLAYRQEGHGPTTLLVHAGFLDSRAWLGLIPVLARDRTVVAPDRRGHGSSGAYGGHHRLEDDVDDLVDMTRELDPEGHGVQIVAHSAGCHVALAAACTGLPISRLVMYEPPAFGDPAIEGSVWQQLADAAEADDRRGLVELVLSDVVGASTGKRIPSPAFSALFSTPFGQMLLDNALAIPTELHAHEDFIWSEEAIGAVDVPILLLIGADSPPFNWRFADWRLSRAPLNFGGGLGDRQAAITLSS